MTFKIIIMGEHLCALCKNVKVPICRPDSYKGYRHDSERGYQCGKVRWGRAATQWARSGNLIINAPLFCLITRNTLLNTLLGRS